MFPLSRKKFRLTTTTAILLSASIVILFEFPSFAQLNTRQNPANLTATTQVNTLKNITAITNRTKQSNGNSKKASIQGANSNNGTSTQPAVCEKDLSVAIDKCARPLMDIIEGKLKKWPSDEKEAIELCGQVS